jgi:hypothetical protein
MRVGLLVCLVGAGAAAAWKECRHAVPTLSRSGRFVRMALEASSVD